LLICDTADKKFCTVLVEEMGTLGTRSVRCAQDATLSYGTLITMEGRSADTEDAKRAPLSAATAAIEATLYAFIMGGIFV